MILSQLTVSMDALLAWQGTFANASLVTGRA